MVASSLRVEGTQLVLINIQSVPNAVVHRHYFEKYGALGFWMWGRTPNAHVG